MCKIRKFLFLGVILAALVSCTSRTKPYDIYLCIGQSNMAGRGDMLPGDDKPLEGVFLAENVRKERTPGAACGQRQGRDFH